MKESSDHNKENINLFPQQVQVDLSRRNMKCEDCGNYVWIKAL